MRANFQPFLAAVRKFVVGVPQTDALRLEVAARVYMVVSTAVWVGLAAVLIHLDIGTQPAMDMQWWFLPLLGAGVFFSDKLAHSIAESSSSVQSFSITYSDLFVLPVVLTMGLRADLLAVMVSARALGLMSERSKTGGWMGVLANCGLLSAQIVVVGVGVQLLHPILTVWHVAAICAVAGVIVMNVTLSGGMAFNQSGGRFNATVFRGTFKEISSQDLWAACFTVPFCLLSYFALQQTHAALVCSFAPLILTLVSNRHIETLSEAKRELGTDDLTRLANRRRFWQTADQMFASARDSGRPLSILMMDIDNFKVLNDTHGHIEGDEALRSVGEALSTISTSSCLIARYGGEEFAVLVQGGSISDGHQIAQQCLEACRRALAPWQTSVSIGLASYTRNMYPDLQRANQLVAIADRALYSAKHDGKDRIATDIEEADLQQGRHLEPVADLDDELPPVDTSAAA